MNTEIKLGRFEGISNDAYHQEMLWAYSNSDLKEVCLSPSNLIQRRNGPKVESSAKTFGRAFHSRIEFYDNEDAYLKLVAVPPSIGRQSTSGKEAHAKFEAEAKGKLILDQKEWDQLENMLLALKAHPEGNSLLMAKGIAEETFVWKDPDSGVICKCRPDKRILEAPPGLPDNMVIDWKTSSGCDFRSLQNDIAEYDYHMQAAFYLDGMRAVLGHDVGPFVNVFIEKGYNYKVVCAVINDDDIELGRLAYKQALQRIAESQKTGIWPGFVDFSLPNWKKIIA